MNARFQSIKPLIVTLLALLAAIAVTLGAIQLRVRLSANPSSGDNTSATAPSDAEKLQILASLSASSSPSKEEKSKTLRSLSTPAKNTPTEEEKLKILESLQAKP